ncbi:MAG: hypothetical protein H2045_11745 [Rhizobiales bacterium]|nr:hypothetical protein [Hyphomicrobiales bacterium]
MLLPVNPVGACGADSDCKVVSGDYRIYLPARPPILKATGQAAQSQADSAGLPVIIFIHGLGGSSADMLARHDYRRLADDLNVAFVAVNGLDHSWTFPGGVQRTTPPRDEFAYIGEVVSDIKNRFPVDPKKIILSGFSIGASMTWNIACRDPSPYAGFITVAGTFWRPLPEKCAQPIANLYHFHGTGDRTFPLSGRIVKGKHQGDTFETFKILYNQDICTRAVQKSFEFIGLRCMRHQTCEGKTVQLCLHDRTHIMRPFFLEAGFYQIAKALGWPNI